MTLLRVGLLALALTSAGLAAQCPPRGGGGSGPGPQPTPPPPVYGGPGDITPTPAAGAPSPATPLPGIPHAPRPQTGPTRVLPPGVPASAGAARPRGAATTFTHRGSAKERLRVDWIYPDLAPVRPEGDTAATPRSVARPAAEMLAVLAGDDPRPLLILRECHRCQGSEAALLDRDHPNEKTLLLARWFRCIRLGDSTRHETHPCHLLFAEHGMPHLLLWSPVGRTVEMLDGSQPQSRLWSLMRKVLRQSYAKDPDAAVSELFAILGQLDHLDSMTAEVAARLQTALDEEPKTSERARALEAELAKLDRERDAVLARERAVMDLGLRRPESAAPR